MIKDLKDKKEKESTVSLRFITLKPKAIGKAYSA